MFVAEVDSNFAASKNSWNQAILSWKLPCSIAARQFNILHQIWSLLFWSIQEKPI